MTLHHTAHLDTLGARIRWRREGLGLTQAQLARRLQCSTAAIWTWESDERQPRCLGDLAIALDCPADWLIGRGPFTARTLAMLDRLREWEGDRVGDVLERALRAYSVAVGMEP